MKFHIKSLDGREFELNMDNESTVSDLKSQIEQYYKVSLGADSTIENADDIKLLYCARALKNNFKLSQIFDVSVSETHNLHLIIPRLHRTKRYIPKKINDFYSDRLVTDLNRVGIEKAMGYLTIGQLEESGYDISQLKQSFLEKGIDTYINHTNFFYAYHKASLQILLDNNHFCLERNNWPTEADFFVFKVGSETATDRELWNLIHRAFTDPTCIVKDEKNTLPSVVNILINSQTSNGILLSAPSEDAEVEDKNDFTIIH